MIKYLTTLNVNEVCFNWLIKVGRLTENEDVCVPLARFDDITLNLQNLMKKYANQIKISMHRSCKFEHSNLVCPGRR